jgi:hypothetical protein
MDELDKIFLKEVAEINRYVSVEILEPIFKEWRKQKRPDYEFKTLSNAQDRTYETYKTLMRLINL